MSEEGPKGAILQRDKKTYAIVPRTPVGVVTPEILDSISRVARKYQIPIIKITSGQRLALVGLKEEDVDQAWDDLQIGVGQAIALCLHYVQACPGTEVCKLGVQDSLGFGQRLENSFTGVDFPAKMKLGVSGCPMCCAESFVRDVGFVGKHKGWTMIVGGHSGSRPRIGDILAEGLTQDEAFALAQKFMDYYRINGKKRERTARFVERVGIEAVKAAVLS